ncbi:MAG: hypothetical protein LQ346_000781 [Caloplaca aetnensis]|nr:MAG: hypothetical protein LQ346_000781 [Caloplaca aetnensis]
MFRPFFVLLAVLVSCSSSLRPRQQKPLGERGNSPFSADFEEHVAELSHRWHVPGLSIAVVDGNNTFSKGFGISSFPSTHVTSSTLFYTGSTTKAFTAAALALLIDDSANSSSPLFWTTPLSSLIRSDFVLPDDYATLHATLEDAASHRTGMPGHDSSYGGPHFSLRDAVRNLRNLPMTAEIRTKFQYCNMMYMTLSHVIETLTSSWLGDVLRIRIWEPLNMTRTYFSLAQAKQASESGVAELAKGYMWNNRTRSYSQIPWMDLPLASGAGNIISTVDDYTKWLHFLLSQSPPLSKAGHRSLRHPRIVLADSPIPGIIGPSTYALGWNVETYRGEPLISHSGGVPGFGAFVAYLPRRGYGVVMMGNAAEAAIVELTLTYQLLDDFLGIPERERGDIGSLFEKLLIGPAKRRVADPVKALYPDAPTGKDAIPLSLPVENYTGVYFNPGYRNVTITLAHKADVSDPSGSTMHILSSDHSLQSVVDRTWAFHLSFLHVSGEFFVVQGYPDMPGEEVDMDPLQVLLLKAEFRAGEDGRVTEFGASLEPQMGEEKIWFRKVEDIQ